MVSGYGAESRHQVPRSTVLGGQVPASSSAVLPSTLEASLTVGIADAGNFLFLPSSNRPPACGLVLSGWPSIAPRTAWPAALASPVVENTSATNATVIAGEGRRRLIALAWDRVLARSGERLATRQASSPEQSRARHRGPLRRASPARVAPWLSPPRCSSCGRG